MSTTTKQEQQGFVSIFSVIVIMSVITLITIGFTYSTRESVRRTLDDQLNTQAFYAAESGVNDAIANMASYPLGKNDCGPEGSVDGGLNVSYTCVLIDNTPPRQHFSPVPVEGTDVPIVTRARVTSPIAQFRFEWDDANDSATEPLPSGAGYGFSAGNSPILPNVGTWGNRVGIVRVDIVPTDSWDRGTMIDNSYSFYLYPMSGAGSNSQLVVSGQANIAGTALTNCGGTGMRCRTTVTLGGSGAGRQEYWVRMTSLYNPVEINMEALDASGTVLDFYDGQAVIDSTGKANDVFRRIQVFVRLSQVEGYPESFAISSAGSICKRLRVIDGTSDIDRPGGMTAASGICEID